MRQQYKFVRLPKETYEKYQRTKLKMENDLREFTGSKNVKMNMPKVFEAFVNPKVNRRWIEIDYADLYALAKLKRGRKL